MAKNNIIRITWRSKLLLFLLLLSLISSLVAVTALRSNYSTMVKLRSAVVVADEQNGDTEMALQQLRQHVYSHMNTNLSSGSNPIKPPIQLKARYERLVQVEQARVKEENAKVTARGEAICGERFPGTGFNSARVACVTDYVSANAAKEASIPEDLYKFDFASPTWSPDLAGTALLVAVMSSVAFLIILSLKLIQRHH